MRMHIILHDLGIGDTSHYEHLGRMVDVAFLQRIEVDQHPIAKSRIEDRLVETCRKIGHNLGLLLRTQRFRALCHDNHVGTGDARYGFAKTPSRQQHVLVEDAVVTAQADGETRFHTTVLHRIVEDNNLRRSFELQQRLNSMHATGIDRNNQERELAIELVRFVPQKIGCNLGVGFSTDTRHCHMESLATPLIAAAQHGNGAIAVAMEEVHEILGMRGLARTSYGQIADADDGHNILERCGFDLSPIEQLFAHPHSQPVKAGERSEQSIIFYLGEIHEHI